MGVARDDLPLAVRAVAGVRCRDLAHCLRADSSIAVLFGLYEETSAAAAVAAIPVFAWEMSLAGCTIAKVFSRRRHSIGVSHPLGLSSRVATVST